MKKLKALWQSAWKDVDRRVSLGRILGLTFVTLGFIVIGKAWDGAASQNIVQAQMPYLLSGGFMGIGLIITGCTLLFLSTIRTERKNLTDQYEEMTRLLGRNLSRLSQQGSASNGKVDYVIAGESTYHLPGCRILEGKELMTVTVEQAVAEGLDACRVCDPPVPAKSEEVPSN